MAKALLGRRYDMLNLDTKEFFKEIESSEFVTNLKELSGKEVEVGFFHGKEHPVNSSTVEYARMYNLGPSKPIDTADLAAVLNYGSYATTNPIPARAFFDDAVNEIEKKFEQNADEYVQDKDFYNNFATEAKEAIYKSIDSSAYAPLAPITAQLKGSQEPFIGDSGTLISSVTSEVK
jgi:hypothetical protein